MHAYTRNARGKLKNNNKQIVKMKLVKIKMKVSNILERDI